MGKRCLVCGYTQSVISVDRNRSFHRFPKNPDRRNDWLRSLGLQKEDLRYNRLICGDHFLPRDFIIKPGGSVWLKHCAIPRRPNKPPPVIQSCSLPTNSVTPQPHSNTVTNQFGSYIIKNGGPPPLTFLSNFVSTGPPSHNVGVQSGSHTKLEEPPGLSKIQISNVCTVTDSDPLDTTNINKTSPSNRRRRKRLEFLTIVEDVEDDDTLGTSTHMSDSDAKSSFLRLLNLSSQETSPLDESTISNNADNDSLVESNHSQHTLSTLTASEVGEVEPIERDEETLDAPEIMEEVAHSLEYDEEELIATAFNTKRRFTRMPRYFGDFMLKDMENPNLASHCWRIANKTIFQLKRKVTQLQNHERNLKKRLTCLRSLFRYLDKNNFLNQYADAVVKAVLQDDKQSSSRRRKQNGAAR